MTLRTLHYHQQRRILDLIFSDGTVKALSAEFLRVHSPSAEVRGHGKPVLQTGKQNVGLSGVETAGRYAIKLIFDDGHDSGLYTWDYLYQLATQQSQRWDAYLEQLHQAGASRDPEVSAVRFIP